MLMSWFVQSKSLDRSQGYFGTQANYEEATRLRKLEQLGRHFNAMQPAFAQVLPYITNTLTRSILFAESCACLQERP